MVHIYFSDQLDFQAQHYNYTTTNRDLENDAVIHRILPSAMLPTGSPAGSSFMA